MSASSPKRPAEQEGFGLAGGVVADGKNHARFGDGVVDGVLTDDRVGQHVFNLADACSWRWVARDEIRVVIHEIVGNFDAAPRAQRGKFGVQSGVVLSRHPDALDAGHFG